VPIVGLPYLNRDQFTGSGNPLTGVPEKLRNGELHPYVRVNMVTIPGSADSEWRRISSNSTICRVAPTALFVRNNMLYLQVMSDEPYSLAHLPTTLREKATLDGNHLISRISVNLGVSDDYSGPTIYFLVFSDTITAGDDFQSLYFDATLENPNALVRYWNKGDPNLPKIPSNHLEQISDWAVMNDLAWCPFGVRCTFWEETTAGEKFWEFVMQPGALSFERRWGKANTYRTAKFQTSNFSHGSTLGKEVHKLLKDKLGKKKYAPKYQKVFRKGEIAPTTVDKLMVKVDRSLQRRILREE
jgi:predicted DNA-binding WGR domain protein